MAVAAALAALALGLVSTIVAVTGEVELGVVAEDPGGVVLEVTPYGAAWTAGIRAGQRVLTLIPSFEPGGWALETTDGSTVRRVTSLGANAALRASAAAAIAAAALALLALRDSRSQKRRSELFSVLALVLSATPFVVVDQPITANVALVAAGSAPAVWLSRWALPRRSLRVAAVGSALLVSTAWSIVRANPAIDARPLGDAWTLAVAAGTFAVLALGASMTPQRAVRAIAAVRLLDGAVAVVAVVVTTLSYVVGLPIPWAVAIGLLPVLLYARARGAIRTSLDRILLAELRERAAMRATEAERARMARDLHDDPLQAIAGVIQRLEEPSPDTGAARESLRDVAARLRGVATDLHPPVLDDLGLVPAIESAARTAGDRVRIDVRVEDQTGYSVAERPPSDVEVAVFRIVQEAIANAVKHSRGKRITVSGRVAAMEVELVVADDGVGFGETRASEAVREGHFGMTSMSQRAASIGAAFAIARPASGGTSVSVRWSA